MASYIQGTFCNLLFSEIHGMESSSSSVVLWIQNSSAVLSLAWHYVRNTCLCCQLFKKVHKNLFFNMQIFYCFLNGLFLLFWAFYMFFKYKGEFSKMQDEGKQTGKVLRIVFHSPWLFWCLCYCVFWNGSLPLFTSLLKLLQFSSYFS